MNPKPDKETIDPRIFAFYEGRADEDTRFSQPRFELEKLRTMDLLDRLLPSPPAVLLDVGGATGVYAVWLKERGYEVHLIDPVPRHVEKARARLGAAKGSAAWSARLGHAGLLDFVDDFADAALLMGPLYHLQRRDDRMTALGETLRVLRPGAFAFIVGVSRFASLHHGLASGRLEDPDFAAIVERDLKTGLHTNTTNDPALWTHAFFHLPEELEAEVRGAGFIVEAMVSIDGPRWAEPHVNRLIRSGNRNRLLSILRSVEKQPSLLGAGRHFAALARKPV